MGLAHWGNSKLGGRGLVALVGKGQVYQLTLELGEEFIVHPSNLLGYTITQDLPQPYRLKSSTLKLQIPSVSLWGLFPNSKFVKAMRDSGTWKTIVKFYLAVRTWSRRTIWGDRLFLRFRGPTTILMQSRSSRYRDVLTSQDVNELADAEPGAVQSVIVSGVNQASSKGTAPKPFTNVPASLKIASIGPGGNVEFQDTNDFQSLSRSH
ncbi:MAG: Altered inheritance of mitochondria protein 24, mitochondrial [Geoglossum simile]|nr:MAG: Altered inheritance of mitochondria protein 24, mitochondrial [Geoglossum simile]